MSTNIELAVSERDTTIAALRDLADFLAEHPDCPMPYLANANAFVDTREEMRQAIRSIGGKLEKGYDENFMTVRKDFGPISYEINIRRELVCNRRVVGTRTVPERTEDVVEWDCGNIMDEEVSQ
jgi:hypothetical protein